MGSKKSTKLPCSDLENFGFTTTYFSEKPLKNGPRVGETSLVAALSVAALPIAFFGLCVTKRGDVCQNGEAPSVVSFLAAPRLQIPAFQAMKIVANEIINEIYDWEERARAAWQFAEESKQRTARLILRASPEATV